MENSGLPAENTTLILRVYGPDGEGQVRVFAVPLAVTLGTQ